MKTIGDNIITQEVDPSRQNMSQGGIYLPANTSNVTKEMEVVSVGDGRLSPNGVRVPLSVQVGDRVLVYAVGANLKVNVDAKEYVILKEADVLVILGNTSTTN